MPMKRFSMLTALLAMEVFHAFGAEPIRQGPETLDPVQAGIGRIVRDVAFSDVRGTAHKLGDFRSQNVTVVAMTSTTCPLSRKYLPELARLGSYCKDVGATLILVNPMASEEQSDILAAARELGADAIYVHDKTNALAEALGAATTTEAFVLDAARTVLYRGAVSDQYGLGYVLESARNNYVMDAIGDYLTGQAVRVAATSAPGCTLDLRHTTPSSEPITYHNRVSRIIQNHCIECHRTDGVAPFSLETYRGVKRHSGMIRRVVERGMMPPWFASQTEGHGHSPWANDRSLAARDRADLLAWLNSEKEEGDPTVAPLPRKFPLDWTIGTPDAVVPLPAPIAVKAEGVMEYRHVDVPTDFGGDRWVRSLEVQPTARGVVHHVLVFIIPKDATPAQRRQAEADGFFAAYVPGNSNTIYPDGYAKSLPAGATLRFQIHYTPNGKATEDQTRLGLVFADGPPRHEVRTAGILNTEINIPPGAAHHREIAAIRLPVDLYALSFFPHMHLRGKAIRYEAVSSEGDTQILLDVPRYDFNWQLSYRLRNPMPLERGTHLRVVGWFDNSLENPANPDPTATVRWGPQTYDEMLLGYVEYYLAEETASGR